MRYLQLLTIITCLLVSSLLAHAQSTTSLKAQALYQKGLNAQKASKHAEASEAFAKAYGEDRQAIFLHLAAQQYFRAGRIQWAWMLARCANLETKAPLSKGERAQNQKLLGQLSADQRLGLINMKSFPSFCQSLDKGAQFTDRQSKSPPSSESSMLVVGRSATGMGMKGSGSAWCGTATSEDAQPVKVTVSLQELQGACSKTAVEERLQDKKSAMQRCHKREDAEGVFGDVTLSWRIDSEGSVSSSKMIASTLGDKKAEACLTKLLQGVKFKSPQQGECQVRAQIKAQASP